MERPLKDPKVSVGAMLRALDEDPRVRELVSKEIAHRPIPERGPTPQEVKVQRDMILRENTFEGRRAGETKAFSKRRQKNRVRNKLARKARKR